MPNFMVPLPSLTVGPLTVGGGALAIPLPSIIPAALDLTGYFPNPRVRRMVDNLAAEITIDEDHDDDLEITQHPVQTGAAISDHAYKRPAELRLRVGWSNAYVRGDVRTVYDDILALQAERRPFKVYTGKRDYENMLVASVRVHTDAKLEYTLIADMVLRQILLVDTQSESTGTAAKAADKPTDTAKPDKNTNTVDRGTTRPERKPDVPDRSEYSGEALLQAGGT